MLGFARSATSTAAVKGSASATIARTVDSVFDFVARDFFSNYRRWCPQVVDLDPSGPVPLRAGMQARQVTLDRGIRCESTFEVAEVEPPARLVLEGVSEPFRSSYRFESAPAGGTGIVFEFEMRELELAMRPFAKLIRAALQDGAEQTVENLKSLLESDPRGAEQARAS
jgi:hypothetical protein